MKLNLHEIIYIPGKSIPFAYELDGGGLSFDGFVSFQKPLKITGMVENRAGVLQLVAEVRADMHCVCARCLKEISLSKIIPISEKLSEDDEAEGYCLEGDTIDVDEVVFTSLTLDMDTRFLCKKDCMGLCESCGADLNLGACNCKKIDPRFAVLEELL